MDVYEDVSSLPKYNVIKKLRTDKLLFKNLNFSNFLNTLTYLPEKIQEDQEPLTVAKADKISLLNDEYEKKLKAILSETEDQDSQKM